MRHLLSYTDMFPIKKKSVASRFAKFFTGRSLAYMKYNSDFYLLAFYIVMFKYGCCFILNSHYPTKVTTMVL